MSLSKSLLALIPEDKEMPPMIGKFTDHAGILEAMAYNKALKEVREILERVEVNEDYAIEIANECDYLKKIHPKSKKYIAKAIVKSIKLKEWE